MAITVREWRVRLHAIGTDIPSDASVSLVLSDEEHLAGPPSGIGSQSLYLLAGRLESQPYTLIFADLGNIITSHSFEGGQLSIIGRWAEVQTRANGGEWTRADLRRISRVSCPGPAAWEWELTSDASLMHELLFERSADIQLYPLGPAADWHRHPAVGFATPYDAGRPGEVLDVDGDLVRVSLDSAQSVPREMIGVVQDHLGTLRLEMAGASYPVISFAATSAPVSIEEAIGLWIGDPPRMPAGVWVEMTGHAYSIGQYIDPFRLWWPDGVPTSPVTPRLIGPAIDETTQEVTGIGYRLDALVRDVLEGEFGGRRIPYDKDALEELAALGDEGHWFVAAGPISRTEFLRDYVWRPYLLAPQLQADGALHPLSVWTGDAVDPTGLYRFDRDNVEGVVRFDAGGTEVANAWWMEARSADRRLPVAATVFPRLDITPTIRARTTGATIDVEQPHALRMPEQVMRRVWADAAPDLYAARVFSLAGAGVGRYSFAAAVEDSSPAPGDLVVLDMDDLQAPEAQSASRMGSRLAIVISRTRSYGPGRLAYEYMCWDAGARAHSPDHADAAHADTHSDSNAQGHFDAHYDEHIDLHQDEDHVDGHGDNNHGDVHEDSAHDDTHADGADHVDLHNDGAHADEHTDSPHSDHHTDTPHGDQHSDYDWHQIGDHCDAHAISGGVCNHTDTHSDEGARSEHIDQAHGDTHDDEAEANQHADIDHADDHGDGGHVDLHHDSAHTDQHMDAGHVDDHADLAHTDLHQDGEHADAHDDAEHTDWHSDALHQDDHADGGHSDTHADSQHTDSHGDIEHTDEHTDFHGDSHGDQGAHADVPHGDTAGPEIHQDHPHQDSPHVPHSDSHTDTPHSDSHVDVPIHSDHVDVTGFRASEEGPCNPELLTGIPCHDDQHSDAPIHTDLHGDTPHSDVPHADSGEVDHVDTPHFDEAAHSDVPHEDAAHRDTHSDTAHQDVPHSDISHSDAHGDDGHSDTHTDSEHTDAHSDSEHSDAHRDGPHNDVHADLVN
ncbi:MAG: hypothetical protein M0R75_01500 [Dehalococcoidia bacterium]|nr:hypothetical protein [Dehalococcoidia bacterium]